MRDARGVGCLIMLSAAGPPLIGASAGALTAPPIFIGLTLLMIGAFVFTWHYRR